MNPNRSTPRHIIIKMAKVKNKERILKATKKRELVIYKGTPITLSPDFPTKILQDREISMKYSKI